MSPSRSFTCLLGITAFVVSCSGAIAKPGQNVKPDFAREWGCDYSDVMTEAARLKSELREGRSYMPVAGWDACELMARIGAPERVRHSDRMGTRFAEWLWSSKSGEHKVTLRLDRQSGKKSPWLVYSSEGW